MDAKDPSVVEGLRVKIVPPTNEPLPCEFNDSAIGTHADSGVIQPPLVEGSQPALVQPPRVEDSQAPPVEDSHTPPAEEDKLSEVEGKLNSSPVAEFGEAVEGEQTDRAEVASQEGGGSSQPADLSPVDGGGCALPPQDESGSPLDQMDADAAIDVTPPFHF
jgi:hypothetical protein